jgi:hypothetical protein
LAVSLRIIGREVLGRSVSRISREKLLKNREEHIGNEKKDGEGKNAVERRLSTAALRGI